MHAASRALPTGPSDSLDWRSGSRRHRYPSGIFNESVRSETWTYDLGPDRFVVIATLEDGKVVSLERGGYGYAR